MHHRYNNAREVGCANCVTIPGLFKDGGYLSAGLGKIFHPGHASTTSGTDNDPQSWTDASTYFVGTDPYVNGTDAVSPSWLSVNETAGGDCQDSQIADRAVATLQNVSAPFFLAVGFHKPHLKRATGAVDGRRLSFSGNDARVRFYPRAVWRALPSITTGTRRPTTRTSSTTHTRRATCRLSRTRRTRGRAEICRPGEILFRPSPPPRNIHVVAAAVPRPGLRGRPPRNDVLLGTSSRTTKTSPR